MRDYRLFAATRGCHFVPSCRSSFDPIHWNGRLGSLPNCRLVFPATGIQPNVRRFDILAVAPSYFTRVGFRSSQQFRNIRASLPEDCGISPRGGIPIRMLGEGLVKFGETVRLRTAPRARCSILFCIFSYLIWGVTMRFIAFPVRANAFRAIIFAFRLVLFPSGNTVIRQDHPFIDKGSNDPFNLVHRIAQAVRNDFGVKPFYRPPIL